MTHTNLSYRCYILPLVGGITYYILAYPTVDTMFSQWIPDPYYALMVKGIILIIVLFLTCRLLDLVWTDMCHSQDCIEAATCTCNSTTEQVLETSSAKTSGIEDSQVFNDFETST